MANFLFRLRGQCPAVDNIYASTRVSHICLSMTLQSLDFVLIHKVKVKFTQDRLKFCRRSVNYYVI
jgi:hypothetical protein